MTDNIAVTPGSGVTVLADGLTDGVLGAGIAQFVKLMDGTLDSSNKLIVTSGGAAKVDPTGQDFRPTSGVITTVDAGTSTAAGQNGVLMVSGVPTANSYQHWSLNGHSSAALTISGTFAGALQIETSADGASYVASSAKQLGSALLSASATAPGVFRVDVTGMTDIRVRATAFASGTATVQLAASAAAGLSQVLNPVRLTDASGNAMTITANGVKVDNSAVIQPVTQPLSVLQYADATRTRPNNATAYAASQYIGDATDSAFKFTALFRANGGTGYLNELRLFMSKSGGLTLPAGTVIRAMIYNAAGSAVADQATFNLTEALRAGEGRLGFVDFTTTYTGGASSDEVEMVAAPTWPMLLQAAAGAKDLYVVLIATGAWTPVASTVFNLRASVSLEQ